MFAEFMAKKPKRRQRGKMALRSSLSPPTKGQEEVSSNPATTVTQMPSVQEVSGAQLRWRGEEDIKQQQENSQTHVQMHEQAQLQAQEQRKASKRQGERNKGRKSNRSEAQQQEQQEEEVEIDECDARQDVGSWLIFRCLQSGDSALRLLVVRDRAVIVCGATSGRLRTRLDFSQITAVQRDLGSKLIRIKYRLHGTGELRWKILEEEAEVAEEGGKEERKEGRVGEGRGNSV